MRRRCHYDRTRGERRAFSLVELVIVVTIIGVLASIAVPRMSRGLADANANALEATLANVRKAIDVYYAEHDDYPGYTPATGAPDNAAFVDQLVKYSDGHGNTNPTYSTTYRFGPYLRSPFPRNPKTKLDTVYVKPTPGAADPADGAFGWVAVLSHGYFGVSLTDADLDDLGFVDPEAKDALRGTGIAF